MVDSSLASNRPLPFRSTKLSSPIAVARITRRPLAGRTPALVNVTVQAPAAVTHDGETCPTPPAVRNETAVPSGTRLP